MRSYALALSAILFASPAASAEWSGFYVGAHAAGAFGSAAGTLSGPVAADLGEVDLNGPGGGGHIGYGQQFGRLYVGLEGDATALSTEVEESERAGAITLRTSASLDYTASIRGRLGYAGENFLIYATGGYAIGRYAFDVTASGGGLTASIGDEKTSSGAVVGGGIEWATSDNWALRVEALHFMFEDVSFNLAGGYTLTADPEETIVRIGVTYRP